MVALRPLQPLPVLVLTLSLAWSVAGAAATAGAPPLFDDHVSFSPLGGVGLIHTGNARFMGEGEIAVGGAYGDPFGTFFVTWQATPWLEATARLRDSFDAADDFDRALDLKLRLFREGEFWPALALGLRDVLGRGPLSGEYLALSKRFGPLDATVGAGWGYLSARHTVDNPLGVLGNRYETRDPSRSGMPQFKSFLRGDKVGFFAGLEYMTPIRGLSFKVEYDSSDFRTLDPALTEHKPYNLAVDYRPLSWLHLSLGYLRGDSVSAGLTIRLNPERLTAADKPRDPKPATVAPPPARRQTAAPLRHRVPAAPPPALAAPEGRPTEDALTRVSRALVAAGIEAPLFELDNGGARLTASFAPESAPRQSLHAAYITFANLPASYDRLVVRNRRGDAVGGEGQVFTRDLVAGFARADAAFDDLIKAGGVTAVTLAGDEVTATLTVQTAAAATAGAIAALAPGYDGGAAAAPGKQTGTDGPDHDQRRQQIVETAAEQGLRPLDVALDGRTASLTMANPRFSEPAQAIGRGARALVAGAPPEAEWLEVTTIEDGAELSRVRFLKQAFTDAVHHRGSPAEIWINTGIGRRPGGVGRTAGPLFSWAIYPELVQHFGGGAEDGYRIGAYATAEGRLEFGGLTVTAAASREIYSDLDHITPRPAALGPRVRSDIARYADEGATAITTARADYLLHPFKDLYVRASAGLFERMYGGAGIEALYAPQAGRLAVALDVNWVKQRDFDQLFDFRDHSTWTGHLRLYHETPRIGLRTAVSVGRYLAEDLGATLDVSREFPNGLRIGAWVSVTDFGRTAFGSGSYAKGLYLTIPFDLGLPWSSRRSLPIEARALNRDGGQMLDRPHLYDMVRGGQAHALEGSWRHILD